MRGGIFGNVLSFSVVLFLVLLLSFLVFFCIFLSSFVFDYVIIVFASCRFQFFYCFNVLGLRNFFGLGRFVVGALDLYVSPLTTRITVRPPPLKNHFQCVLFWNFALVRQLFDVTCCVLSTGMSYAFSCVTVVMAATIYTSYVNTSYVHTNIPM